MATQYKRGYKQDRPRNADGTFAYCEELEQRQIDMIHELIANGGHKTKACETLDIPRSTLYKWLDNEKFKKAYLTACERLYEEGLSDAIKTTLKLMKCQDSRTALKACENIMKLNGYLDTKVDVTQNPAEIVITLADNND